MSEKSTLLPTQPVHNVNETTTSQKVAGGLALFCAGTTVGLAWRYVQYTITGGGMNWGSKVWGYHPLLMTLAFGAFICGSLVYRLPEDFIEPRRRKAVHGTCHFAALVFGTVGLIAVWRSHGLAASTADGANLYSMHGWFGFSVCMLALAQSCSALGVFGSGVASNAYRAAALQPHRAIGRSLLVFWAGAIVSGVTEKNGFIGICSYTVSSFDWNPAKNYDEIPDVCACGQWLGLFAFFSAVFAIYALAGFD